MNFAKSLCLGLMLGAVAASFGQTGSPFDLKFESGRIVSLKCVGDAFPTDYISPRTPLGNVHVTLRPAGGTWKHFSTETLTGTPSATGATYACDNQLQISSEFSRSGDALLWSFSVKNLTDAPLEIGDLATVFQLNTRFQAGTGPTRSVFKHSFISGDGSFIFWMRPNTIGPYLLMTPEKGTTPEYWDTQGPYEVFVHSRAAGDIAKAKGTKWRIPETSETLKPGQTSRFAYRFRWAKDYDDVRRQLAESGQIDVQIVPGMTVPTDLEAQVALHTDRRISSVQAEFPAQTTVSLVKKRGATSIYKVHFAKLGENRLTVHYGDGLKTYLEFFSTEPIETLIKKRGAFLAKSQHHDPTKWYRGLISDWNMDDETLLGPDNYDHITGWRIYEVSCDDPGLGKPAFLAAKNAEYPVQSQVDALDDYIQHFVWGGLQQTTSEPFPYGIYGIPDWKTNRNKTTGRPRDGKEHLWRCYDYPHIILLYERMYRMASRHPEIHTALPASTYLERAFGTAQAMYTVPMKIEHWSAYETGFYNEIVFTDLIDDLTQAGKTDEANILRKYWGDKTKFFVVGKPDLFGSEYAFDSTGFESTEALGDYALSHGAELGISQEAARKFLDLQIQENIFCRGWLEPAYYYLGSDYRGGGGNGYVLTYMSQMGGWSVLDYGLHHAADPSPYLRLGYASYLSAWALMNTGTPESNYGYWYPGQINDGGAGGGFEPAPYGKTWLDQPHHRGSWYYASEIDLGFSGALRTAATVVTDDPIFGRLCLGGFGRSQGGKYVFEPRDGLRRRVFVRTKSVHCDVVLTGCRFAKGQDLVLSEKAFSLRARISSDSPAASSVAVSGLPMGQYEVLMGGKVVGRFAGEAEQISELPAFSGEEKLELRRLQ